MIGLHRWPGLKRRWISDSGVEPEHVADARRSWLRVEEEEERRFLTEGLLRQRTSCAVYRSRFSVWRSSFSVRRLGAGGLSELTHV
jgi:hypothetical protein